jgi:hypothetical protein
VDELFQDFHPLISGGCKDALLKHVLSYRDKRYIEKLTKELDKAILQIKKTDPRNLLDPEELCPYKSDPALREPKPMRIIAQYRGYLYQRDELGNLIDYEAHEKIEKHKTMRLDQLKELEQVNLRGMKIEPVDPSLTSSVSHRALTKERIPNVKISLYAHPNQKKILQYMHRHHLSMFRSLN